MVLKKISRRDFKKCSNHDTRKLLVRIRIDDFINRNSIEWKHQYKNDTNFDTIVNESNESELFRKRNNLM